MMLISKQHRMSCLDIRAMREAAASSDHKLICCKIRIKLKIQKQQKENNKMKYDTTKLQQPEKRMSFYVELKMGFQVRDEIDSVENI